MEGKTYVIHNVYCNYVKAFIYIYVAVWNRN